MSFATLSYTFQVSNIHRGNCSSLAVSHDGKYLASAGDKVVKIWDYHMRLDINFQVVPLGWKETSRTAKILGLG